MAPPDIFGYAVHEAELWRKIKVVLSDLDREQRLCGSSNFHVVVEVEVLRDGDLFFLEHECHRLGVMVKVDVVNRIRPSVTPISYDYLLTIFFPDVLHPIMVAFGALPQVFYCLQARPGTHEFEDTVHAEHCAEARLYGCCLETSPYVETLRVHDHGVFYVKKSRSFSHLLERGLAECLLNDDVEKLIHHTLRLKRHILLRHGDLRH